MKIKGAEFLVNIVRVTKFSPSIPEELN